MTTEKIEMVRYRCDSKTARVDCWDCEDYKSEEEGRKDGWEELFDGKHLCPYCASKEKNLSRGE